MNIRFMSSIAFTINAETSGRADGAYTNDPDDPGGETKWGISKRYHQQVDIKNLTRPQAERIYFDEYWLPCGADAMPWPLCLAVFDSSVNPGIGATRLFVRAAAANPDKSSFTRALIVCNEREAYFLRQVAKHPHKKKWINGWINRVNALRKRSALPA